MATKKNEEGKTTKTTKAKVEKTETKKKVVSKITTSVSDDDIAKRAYEIFLETGNHDANENWTKAENELKAKKKSK